MWKVGGNTWANIGTATAVNAFRNEITTPSLNTTYDAKIGLIYVSDYAFSTNQDVWIKTLNTYNDVEATLTNWMYMSLYEWTITRGADASHAAFRVTIAGDISDSISVSKNVAIRPVFYLTPSVTYISGSGTENDPFIID